MAHSPTSLKCPQCGGPAIEVKVAAQGRGVRKLVCTVDGCGHESLPYTLASDRAARRRRERMVTENERRNRYQRQAEGTDMWWAR